MSKSPKDRGVSEAGRQAYAAWLNDAMIQSGMTVAELSDRAKVHKYTIEELLRGNRVVGWELTKFMADVLNAPVPGVVEAAVRHLPSHRTRAVREAMEAFRAGTLPEATKIRQDPSVVADRIVEDLGLLLQLTKELTTSEVVDFLTSHQLSVDDKARITKALWG